MFNRAEKEPGLRLAYFVHDVHDPAVGRRIAQLAEGGAVVQVFGFRRREEVLADLAGAPVTDLGRTHDGGFAKRGAAVLQRVLTSRASLRRLAEAEVIIARSLELLVLAAALRARLGLRAPLVYECVDIHRLMLSTAPVGALLRWVERRLLKMIGLLIVTSPAHRDLYFSDRQGYGGATLLVENKTRAGVQASRLSASASPPWRIGWYGVLRCRRSFSLLSSIAAKHDGALHIVMAGRPVLPEIPDFFERVEANPFLTFKGPYSHDDIGELYGQVDFSWCVDHFEAGGNSDWLLPNRLYEGCAWGAVPIGLDRVETGRWMSRHDVGVRLGDDEEGDLDAVLAALTLERYARLKAAVNRLPPSAVVQTEQDTKTLISTLQSLAAK